MVFISHSCKGDQNAGDALTALIKTLEERGWDVQVDIERLKGAEEWRPVIYHWLADCDAAIVLLSAKGLRSPWVRREVNHLLWRRALGSPVTIVPVLLKDLTDQEVVDSELAELAGSLQFVQQGTTPAGVAEQAADRLPSLDHAGSDNSAMRSWSSKVISCLGGITDETPLRSAAQLLSEADDWHFPNVLEGRRYLANQFLGQDHRDRLHLALGEIAFHVRHDLGSLVTLVSPTWVDFEAARKLLPGTGRIIAALNADRPGTAQEYVNRAACGSVRYRAVEVSLIAGEDQLADYEHDCRLAIAQLLYLGPGDPLDGELPLQGEFGFLIIDPPGVSPGVVGELVRRLAASFPWLNIILLAGAGIDDDLDLAPLGLENLPLVSPPLAEGEERLAGRRRRRLIDMIKQVSA